MTVIATPARRAPIGPCADTRVGQTTVPTTRSTQMLLLDEELARARMREVEEQAREERTATTLRSVRRWERIARHANRRAHRARRRLDGSR